MNLKHKITTTVLAASLALTSASGMAQYIDRPGSETNTSETGITRTPRYTAEWTEGEWMYLNYRQGDAMLVTIVDEGTAANAKRYQRTVMTPEAMEYAGLDYTREFRVTGTDECEGMRGDMNGMTTYVVVCIEGSSVAMIIGSDKRDVVDMAQEIEEYGEPDTPRGYVEERL